MLDTFFKICVKIRIYWIKVINKIHYGDGVVWGEKFNFRKNFIITLSKGAKIRIGNNVFFNNNCSISAHKEIQIGDNCIFGENVKIYDHNHIYKDILMPIAKQGYSEEAVFIGENSWICSNVIILKGAKVGRNCVISAGCVVDREIPDDVIVRHISNYITEERR